MLQKPSIPKGTRDFGPEEMSKRNYIFDTLGRIFRKYGYCQIQTPAMENLSTLLGKYGDEGDRLLFKILNSGDAFRDVDQACLDGGSNAVSLKVCEKGLRYDLTVPFARYVVQHRGELVFPFKRYQIQPVWRADRPQKGRYREFYQCDVDAIGTDSILNEIELLQITDEAFSSLGIDVCIHINNRKILSAIADFSGYPDRLVGITTAIDKIENTGLDQVVAELRENGIDDRGISAIVPIITLEGGNRQKLDTLRQMLAGSRTGLQGIAEMDEILSLIACSGIKQEIKVDLSLARGLNYYTGSIFEVKAKDFQIGSICGGGRYDNLTGIFGLKDTSGVGISFGADRIYDVMEALGKFPANASACTEIMFANMEGSLQYIIPIASRLRRNGHAAEIFPEQCKLRKQFEYADKKGIRYVAIAGEEEMRSNEISLKDMRKGTQEKVSADNIEEFLQ